MVQNITCMSETFIDIALQESVCDVTLVQSLEFQTDFDSARYQYMLDDTS